MTSISRGNDLGAGGDDRDPVGGDRQPSSQFQSSKKPRGPTTCENLRKIWKANGRKPLPIEFEATSKTVTGRHVGDNASKLTTLVGSVIGESIPLRYSKWDKVPKTDKTLIWTEIKTYFDMKPHLEGPYRENVIKGIDKLCSERFKDRKSKFKTKWFDNRGGNEDSTAIRLDPPPNMELAEWNKYVDYYINDFNKEVSQINTQNRGKQKAPSRHGTKSYAAHREEKRAKNNGQYPSYIDQYKDMHTYSNGTWVNEVAKTRYDAMKKSLDENSSASTPLSEYEILEETLGVFHGHFPGIGRKLPGDGSSRVPFQPQSKVYTKEEVDRKVQKVVKRVVGEVVETVNTKLSTVWGAFERANIGIPNYTPVTTPIIVIDSEDDEDKEDEEDGDNE